MNERDAKELAVFRRFMSDARGHVDAFADRPSTHDVTIGEAEELRERLILKLGTFPDDEVVHEHAKERFACRGVQMTNKTFDELEPVMRGRWIRSSKLALATFSDNAYRRLANATTKAAIGMELDAIRTKYVREGWVRAAEVALHVPAKLWDEPYVRQNSRGMKALLEELERA